MKSVIVYYSLTENTAKEAQALAESLGADVLRLDAEKAYPDKGVKKFLWGGKSAVMGEKPALKPYAFDGEGYDLVVFGTPVWAGTFAPPLRTFITENADALQGKRFAAFACAGGKNPGKTFVKLETLLGAPLVATTTLVDTDSEETKSEKRKAFCEKLQ